MAARIAARPHGRVRQRKTARNDSRLTGWVKADQPKPFGYLLTLDLYACKSGVCGDIALCYDFLEALVATLGMTKQSPPFIFRSPPEYADKAGLSGWVPLIESGIQIHTLVPKSFISIDVYCCHEFEAGAAIELAQATFAPRNFEANQMPRGIKYHDG